jgi:hypothetical protein
MTERDASATHGISGVPIDELDEPEPPRRVRVPTGRDLFGRPTDFVECDDPAAVGHWDASRWSAESPR